MPSASATADADRERRRRPTADARSRSRDPAHRSASRDPSRDRNRERSHSREPTAASSSSHRSASRDRDRDRDRERSHSREPASSSSSHRSEARDRGMSRDRHHRSPSREKHGSSAHTSSSSSSSRKRPHVRYAAPTDAAALTASASRSGFLRKQADNEQGAWNRYYFVVKSSTLLYYFNAETDDAPRGVIDLEFLTDLKRNSDCLQRAVGGGEHCFRLSGKLPASVRDKMRPLYLDAESAEDASAWIEALREHRFSLAKHELSAASEVQLEQTKRALAKLETEQAQQQTRARSTNALANRVLDRLRRLALSNEQVTAEDALGSSSSGQEGEDDKVDLLGSLQAMESVVSELQLKVAAQQQTIGTLREQVAEHERKQREKALKFVAAGFKKAAATRQNRSMTAAPKQAPTSKPVVESEDEEDTDNVPSSASSSLTSALEDPDKLSAAGGRPKSTSNAMALFTRTKNLAARSKPKARKDDGSDDSPPGSTLSSCIEEEPKPARSPALSPSTGSSRLPMRLRRNTSQDTAPPAAKSTAATGGGGLASVFKKRAAKPPAAAAGLGDSSSSGASNTRESEEETASTASTDDRTSEESAGKAKDKAKSKEDKLPKGWTKHQSRSNPGQFFYAHVSGKTSWVVPTTDPDEPEAGGEDADVSDEEDDEDDGKASTASASADSQPAPKKKKKGWAFKLPRKLTIATSTAPVPAPAASPSAAGGTSAATSPIEHDESHHEF